MKRTFAAALIAAAVVAVPARHAGAQAATKDTAYHPRNVKEAASNTGHEAKRVFKRSKKTVGKAAVDTKNAVVTGADATAKAGKKAGTYVKHRVTPHHKAKPDSTGR
ncbi:hypothetical protein tb265_18840 [Gemmatimonadetes bacterium T265]|nr:hypothetical protein tb265_18840 [Gemmatimonadetes bacterium T265]